MSPVQSRARTPSVTERVLAASCYEEEEYFGVKVPKINIARRKSVDVREKDRRKSSSGESISSLASKNTVKRVG
jgi:hypothetical protein